MASTKKIKVGPIHTTLYANLRLLMCRHSHSNALADVLTEDLFVLPNSNKKASNEVIFFLLKIWDKSKITEKFKFCWPVLDKKQESQFQRAACGFMQEIKAAHPEARLPTVSLALFLQPGGDKYCIFLLRLTTFLLGLTLEGTELATRPVPKKGENLADIKATLKTLAESSFTQAVEACAGSEASLKEADNFKQKVYDWWLSWEESEETAIANFKNEVLKLDLSNELSSLLISNPENVKEFHGIVIKLKNSITETLNKLDGKQNGHVNFVASTSPDKAVPTLKCGMEVGNFNTAKKKTLKSLTELKLLLDLAERQEGWPLHSEAAKLKEKLQNGQPVAIIKQLEERLEAVRGTETKRMKRASYAPSPALTILPCKLRQIPFTPVSGFEKVTPFSFKPLHGPLREEQESVESMLLRWHQPRIYHSTALPEQHQEVAKSPISHTSPTFSTSSPTFASRKSLAVIKESPKSPTLSYFPKDKKVSIQLPQYDLTPPSEAIVAPRVRGRRSFYDVSDDDLAFGDMSLLDLAELHLTLSPSGGSPEPPQMEVHFEKMPAQAAPEPVDVKPDIQSLVARLQAIKDRSKAVPSVLIKTELKSP